MAIIGKIREKSTLVLIIIGGAIIAFVLGDFLNSNTSSQRKPISLAEIDGKGISPQEFEAKVQKAYSNYVAQTQQELDERTKFSIRESVWNEILSDQLNGKEMNALGVRVSTKELFDMVQGTDPHPQVRQAFSDPNTGQFNSGAVIQFLQNLDNDEKAKTQWIDFERALKRNQRIAKYNLLIKKGLYSPTELAKMRYADNNTALAIKYVYKPYTSIEDASVEITESEVKEYYEKTKGDYEQKASRKIAYAYFPIVPSDFDKESTKRWVDETFTKFQSAENDSIFTNANSDSRFNPTYYSKENAPVGVDTALWDQEVGFVMAPKLVGNTYSIYKVKDAKMAPDSVQARHILIATQNRTPERAEEMADSLMALLEGGTPMADIVSISDDVASAEKGGDLGWFTEGMMVKPFNDAAFAAEVGSFTKVESQFGFHLVEVTDQTEVAKKIQIAIVEREIKPSRDTYSDLFNLANSFSLSVTDMESFRNEISAKNVQQRSAVLSENDNTVQGLEASRDLARWVNEATEGEVSEAKDVDGAFVVAIVESVDEEGPAPLEKVRNRVEYLVRQDKKAEMIIQEFGSANNLGELASKTGMSVENANITFSSPSIPSVGLEPKVAGVAMSLEAGTGSPSQAIKGNNGVFVISLDKKVDAGEADIAQIRDIQFRGLSARIDNGAVFNSLKEKSDLVDNRSKFY